MDTPYTKLIRYRVRPEGAGANLAALRVLLDDLTAARIPGLGYAVFRAGETDFLHLAAVQSESGARDLHELSGFRDWSRDLADRWVAPPDLRDVDLIGAVSAPDLFASSHSLTGADQDGV